MVRKVVEEYGLSGDILEEALCLHRDADGVYERYSVSRVAAAVVYVACRLYESPLSYGEAGESLGVGRLEVSEVVNVVTDEFGINLEPARPVDYVSRFCELLQLPRDVSRRAEEILGEVDAAAWVFGKSPISMAAAAVYVAARESGRSITQKRIRKSLPVSEPTLRGCYKSIEEELDLDL